MAQDSADWNSDDDLDFQIDNYQSSPPSSPPVAAVTSSDGLFATLIDMGFSTENIARAIEEHGPNADTMVIIDAISKYSVNCEASSSKSKTIDHFLAMGFEEEKVIKAIHEHGEDNIEEIANALISSAVTDAAKEEVAPVVKEEDDFDWSESDDEKYANFLSSDDERVTDSSPVNEDKLRSLKIMGFSELEASLALERCGGDVSVGDLADFIYAAQIAREFDEFHADPEEQKPSVKKRRMEARRESRSSADDEPIRLPIPMIGFGVPNEPGLITQRSIPAIAQRPPYFYYENVALAPKGVWDTISRHLYDIPPEFVDSKYICAAARKRGYVHNLPISGRYQVQPPPKYTISEAFPLSKKWWPSWDKRTKLNCILTVNASAQLTNRIRLALEAHPGEPPESAKKYVIDQCKKWNLVWVGKNKAAPLEPDEMETLLGFPRNHTRGGGTSRTERLKSLGNSFQVDTVAYHLSVLKPLFPSGINVLSLFTGIGGAEVALHRLQIPMKTVVSVEISAVNRNILKDFWEQTNQKGTLIEFADVQDLSNEKIVELMQRFGGFDLVIGGSPCNNLAGGNRVSRSGLEGEQSSLFFEYCRILDVVRETTKKMRRS
ncbi:DNA (cytosine-5)-methyltransferase DRM2 [Raphanus sativus]|uniref:DNA (cytosine-5-)-methyltransferase n=1 Tax=Raphanus sativus TaxID=3726 RepID=A0A6J0KEY6_RAPSA|nr:DNA (cytosine-5)-methyltransferase DRM2 [Raphanus sativus]XP_018446071.1 DNA (cytosine-5)-methyltransferase DRM2 [Raphanus sativus]